MKSDDALVLDAVARRYGQRPSALVGLRDAYTAYCLDEAVMLRGATDQRTNPNPHAPRGRDQTMALGPLTLQGKLGGRVGDF